MVCLTLNLEIEYFEMKKNKKLSSNMEDYLETITVLKKEKGVVRVRDIGIRLGVKNSSVNAALSTLTKNGFVIHEKYGYVDLTTVGKERALEVYGRHHMLLKFLTKILQVNYETASKDACGMEHSVSHPTFEKLTKFIEFIETSPLNSRPEWLKRFHSYLKTGKMRKCRIKRLK